MNRTLVVNVKVSTDFGSLHFGVEHDEQQRVSRIDYRTSDADLGEDSQIGKLLLQCAKGLNKAIEAMNEDWSSKIDVEKIAGIQKEAQP